MDERLVFVKVLTLMVSSMPYLNRLGCLHLIYVDSCLLLLDDTIGCNLVERK